MNKLLLCTLLTIDYGLFTIHFKLQTTYKLQSKFPLFTNTLQKLVIYKKNYISYSCTIRKNTFK